MFKTTLVTLLVSAAIVTAARADFAPDTLTNLAADAVITDGTGYFVNTGAYRLTLGATTAQITPLTPNIPAENLTFTYQKTSATTATLNIVDTAAGVSATEQLVFESPARASYTVTSAIGTQTGKLIFEYAPPTTAAVPVPRLINISTLGQITSGGSMTAGFVISGTQLKTMLVRAAGPSLVPLGVSGTLANPKVVVTDSAGKTVGSNDDWGGDTALANAFAATGAFGYTSKTSKDAALLVTLPAGNYTAQVSSSTGTGSGTVIVEVYEVPTP